MENLGPAFNMVTPAIDNVIDFTERDHYELLYPFHKKQRDYFFGASNYDGVTPTAVRSQLPDGTIYEAYFEGLGRYSSMHPTPMVVRTRVKDSNIVLEFFGLGAYTDKIPTPTQAIVNVDATKLAVEYSGFYHGNGLPTQMKISRIPETRFPMLPSLSLRGVPPLR